MIAAFTAHMKRKNRAAGTIRLRLFYLGKFRAWYRHPLAEAQHDDFRAWLRSNPQWSPATAQSANATIRSFYKWAYADGWLAENPARDLPEIVVPRRRQRIASEEAIQSAIKCDDISDRAMVLLGAECGLRVGEIASLHQRNRDGDWLHVIGKGGHERTLYVSPELGALLDQIAARRMRHGWYFPGRSGLTHMHLTTAWRHITSVLESNPHSLRRRAGTIVYRNSGNDIRLAQTFLGHRQVTTTELYLNVADDDLARAGSLTRVAA